MKDKKIVSAAVRIGGKIYEAKRHDIAIQKAKDDGKDVSNFDKAKNSMFHTSDGRLISRDQAQEEFGVSTSEEIWSDEEVYQEE